MAAASDMQDWFQVCVSILGVQVRQQGLQAGNYTVRSKA